MIYIKYVFLSKNTSNSYSIANNLLLYIYSGIEQRSARQSHKLKVVGSNPSPATNNKYIYIKFIYEINSRIITGILSVASNTRR